MSDEPRDWFPTLGLGFIQDDAGKLHLHQWWINPDGRAEWRKVPLISAYHRPRVERSYPPAEAGTEAGEEE